MVVEHPAQGVGVRGGDGEGDGPVEFLRDGPDERFERGFALGDGKRVFGSWRDKAVELTVVLGDDGRGRERRAIETHDAPVQGFGASGVAGGAGTPGVDGVVAGLSGDAGELLTNDEPVTCVEGEGAVVEGVLQESDAAITCFFDHAVEDDLADAARLGGGRDGEGRDAHADIAQVVEETDANELAVVIDPEPPDFG